MRVILYSKPGCHLCEGLQEKLAQIPALELEVRDITTRADWWQAYQFEIPVLFLARSSAPSQPVAAPTPAAVPSPAALQPLPRPSPRATVAQLAQMLQKYTQADHPQ